MRIQREVVERLRIVLRVELSNKLKNIARILLPYLADSVIAIFGFFFLRAVIADIKTVKWRTHFDKIAHVSTYAFDAVCMSCVPFIANEKEKKNYKSVLMYSEQVFDTFWLLSFACCCLLCHERLSRQFHCAAAAVYVILMWTSTAKAKSKDTKLKRERNPLTIRWEKQHSQTLSDGQMKSTLSNSLDHWLHSCVSQQQHTHNMVEELAVYPAADEWIIGPGGNRCRG